MVSTKMIYDESLSSKAKEVDTKSACKTPTPEDMENNVSVRATSNSTDQLGTSPEDMNSKNNVSTSDSKDRLETSLEDKENNLSASATSNSKEQLETSQQNDDSSSQKGTTHRKYQAALKLQKVYKSFRTRRQLADCAILVEQRWWKVLDFAELRRSSISFFDIQKPETAVSRWARARTRAAKVGKGLSKDKKARKLALQHWLEAIDPRHRYGHNLHFYYAKWLHCDSKQPFFYWLDIGEGREVTHEGCPRSKLQTQCIKYLGPVERQAYEVVVVGRKLVYKQSGVIIDTTKSPKGTKWIFVLSVSKDLYVGQKSKGTFQHSSFLAGGATLSAGRLVAEDGILKSIWPHSGHYLPTEENFQEFMSFLIENNVDLTNVTKAPADDEDGGILSKKNSIRVRNSPRRADSSTTNALGTVEEGTDDSRILSDNAENIPLKSRLPEGLKAKIGTLEIPDKDDVFDNFSEQPPMTCREYFIESESESESEDGYETAEESVLTEEDFMVSKQNLFDDEEEHEEEEKTIAISKEKIMQRIDSHKGMNSYQLGQHLTTRWSTGAGPRIGCMRDYPAELQFRVLQQAYLSPRPGGKVMLPPSPLFKETTSAAVTLAAAPPKSRTRRQLTIG